MPLDLDEILAPHRTAVLLLDLQRALVGDLATQHLVAPIVRERDVLGRAAQLVQSARAAGARVVHCTCEFRPDLAGTSGNCSVLAAAVRNPEPLLQGSPGAEVIPELGPERADLVVSRLHGVSPFGGTELDALLRNLGIRTVVAAGVSVNIGVVGMCIEAVNLGYQVVLAADAVAGHPPEYADAMIEHTLRFLATVQTVDQITARWHARASA